MAYFLIGCLFGGTVGFSFACLLFVDVSAIARQFGGGGHKAAAGFSTDQPIHRAVCLNRISMICMTLKPPTDPELLSKLREFGALQVGDPLSKVPWLSGRNNWGDVFTKLCRDAADEIERLGGKP